MRTVWHWKNMFKAALCVLLVPVVFYWISGLLYISEEDGIVFGSLIGMLTTLIVMNVWDLYHFESDKGE